MDINSSLARENADLRAAGERANAGEAAEMTTSERDGVALEAPALEELLGGPAAVAEPIRVHGKSFFAGNAKHFIKGVTYGPFATGTHRAPFPERAAVERDFALMRGAGVNTVRVFTVPPVWLLDMAGEAGLKVLVGLPWSQHVTFLDSAEIKAEIRAAVAAGGRACGRHPAVFAYLGGNEIPPD